MREAIISVNAGKNLFGCSAVGSYSSKDKIVLPAGNYPLKHFDVFTPPGEIDTSGSSNPDCSGTFDSFGFNLVGDVSGCSGFTRISDKKGTAASPIDPRLGNGTLV